MSLIKIDKSHKAVPKEVDRFYMYTVHRTWNVDDLLERFFFGYPLASITNNEGSSKQK